MNIKQIIIGTALALFAIVGIPSLWEFQDASEYLVIQSLGGELNVYTEPGPHWQGFGRVTSYPRQSQYSFCTTKDNTKCDDANSTGKKIRFNDGGHATLNGFVLWEMPSDELSIVKIHKKFRSAEAVQNQAVAKMIDGALYLSGPLMSSTESSGSRRAELVQYINDQAENGIYVTQTKNVTVKDSISGEEKTEPITEIVIGSNGLPKRQQGSLLNELNIKLQPMAINEMAYDSVVENQIAQRQKATTEVQIAIANARKSEQDAITAEAKGRADAAKAKWEQEVIKAKVVTEAQQKLEVAQLSAKEAEAFKQAEILRGQGEAERKRLVLNADGALDKKLDAYVKVNELYADAIAKYQGQWVPSVVMGNQGQASNGAQSMIDMLSVKTAKELALDLGMAGKEQTSKR